jgi:hypothetical protein
VVGGNRLQIGRVATNILNKQLWTASKMSTSLVDDRELTASDHKTLANYKTRRRQMEE